MCCAPLEENFVREIRWGIVQSGLVKGDEGQKGEGLVDKRLIRCCEQKQFLNETKRCCIWT